MYFCKQMFQYSYNMKAKTIIFFFALFLSTPGMAQTTFWLGADISGTTEMESRGVKLYNTQGEERECTALMKEYGISARLTFSNSLLKEEHLADRKCNALCAMFENSGDVPNGVIVTSDLLLEYLRARYPGFYFVSSTTKVLTDVRDCMNELDREEFRYVVPDFRLNKVLPECGLTEAQKAKVEFLCNECCWFECYDRKNCYENVSRKSLGEDVEDHVCVSPDAGRGYRFSDAMKNPGFIGIRDIQETYLPKGFRHFKIEGRGLGSAIVLEFLLYYMTKPEYQLRVREEIYLDSMLDLF